MKEKWKNQKHQKSFDGDCCTKERFKIAPKIQEFHWLPNEKRVFLDKY